MCWGRGAFRRDPYGLRAEKSYNWQIWFSRKDCFPEYERVPFPFGLQHLFPRLSPPSSGQTGCPRGRAGPMFLDIVTEEWTVFGVKVLMPVSNVSSSLFPELEFSECC